MKKIIKKNPVTFKFLLALLLFGLSLFISGLINKGLVKKYFPFSSVICLTITTYFLFKNDNKSLNDIGLNLKWKNLKFLPLGIIIGAVTLFFAKYLRSIYTGETFNFSENLNYKNILHGFYIMLPMVVVEEYLFRGYLFKKTIEISSVIKANIIFSILFTMVHIFDSGVINSIPMIIFTSITIPVGHLLFATALLKSKSLFFAIGIHLGNNWGTRHLITKYNDGDSFLYVTNQTNFETWPSFIGFILLWNTFFLLVTYIIWKWDSISKLIPKKI